MKIKIVGIFKRQELKYNFNNLMNITVSFSLHKLKMKGIIYSIFKTIFIPSVYIQMTPYVQFPELRHHLGSVTKYSQNPILKLLEGYITKRFELNYMENNIDTKDEYYVLICIVT